MPNPATSSPGLAFLLATIDHFGEDGYLDFWQALKANDVLVTDGWSEAYFEHFTVGSGGAGDRPLVVSYSTSPPADVVYATDGRTAPASINLFCRAAPSARSNLSVCSPARPSRSWPGSSSTSCSANNSRRTFRLQMFVYPANPDVDAARPVYAVCPDAVRSGPLRPGGHRSQPRTLGASLG